MTARASQAADNIPNLPILQEKENVETVGILLVTGDRGLAGPVQLADPPRGQRARARAAVGRQGGALVRGRAAAGVSSLEFRGLRRRRLAGPGFTDRPAFADARTVADGLVVRLRRRQGRPRRGLLQRLHLAGEPGGAPRDAAAAAAGGRDRRRRRGRAEDGGGNSEDEHIHDRALWIYEPDAEEILARLVPDYVEISIYRALLESTASEHGARMSAMRNASDNAAELIDDLTLDANRQRQAEITQEIMEVVAGAEGLR